MSRFYPATLDPQTTVTTRLARYACPDVAAVDAHLTCLAARLAATALPELRPELHRDIDDLLDRRLRLTQVG